MIIKPDKVISDLFSRRDYASLNVNAFTVRTPALLSTMGLHKKLKSSINSMEVLHQVMNGAIFNKSGSNPEVPMFDPSTVFLDLYRESLMVIQKRVDSIAILAEKLNEPVELLQQILSDGTKAHYHTFFIWKDEEHSKKRWISAPNPDLKRIQNKILRMFLYRFGVTAEAHAFAKKKSIVSNSMIHLGQPYLLKIDLCNFFPSISREMVTGALYPFLGMEAFQYIIPMVELCCVDGVLPQGAPTSPAISNIVGSYIDFSLRGICRAKGIGYSRYADDLTFSSREEGIGKMIPIIRKIVGLYGFSVNNSKIHIMTRGHRQKVTGIVVNGSTPSIPRSERMKFRSLLHNIITGKTAVDDTLKNKIKGKHSFFLMVNREQAHKFEVDISAVMQM